MKRRPHLDWLRGVAVLIMIEAHTLDSWTRLADRQSPGYRWAIVVGGFGAPIFLFLAGATLALVAAGRSRRGLATSQISAAALKRGAWILLLAFLFRLQSFLISGGRFPEALLKVDILNIMGVSMMIAAVAWFLGSIPRARIVLFAALTIAAAMLTPLVRESHWLAPLPDPVEAYLRPVTGFTGFTLFPWGGFLTAGCALGLWLDAFATDRAERRLHAWLVAAGCAIGVLAYGASFLPPIYLHTSFWTSSPTFFFIRLGILLAGTGLVYEAARVWRAARLQEFGRASLFVYWVHVELVYGVLSAPIHRALPFSWALAGYLAFAAMMFGLVRVKARFLGPGRPTESPGPVVSPVTSR